MPNDYFVSLIRTWVPIAIGAGLTWLATRFGVVLGDDASAGLTLAAVGVVTAVYYAVARWVEGQWPGLGRILLALGLTSKAPSYKPVEPPRSM